MGSVVSAEPSHRERWLWLAGIPFVAAVGFRLALPHRPDWAGHYLAGFGASLGVTWLACRARSGDPLTVLAATLACIAAGWAVETWVFALAAFDPIDFAAQSIGAVHAGLALLVGRAGDPDADPASDPLLRGPYGRAIVAVALVALIHGVLYAFA